MEAQRVQVTCPGNYFFFDVPHITHTHCLQQSSSSFSPSTSSPEFFISENGTSHRYPDIYIRELGVTVDPFSPSITVFVCHHLLLIVSYLSYPQPRLHLFFFLAVPQGLWDLSFPIRDRTQDPSSGSTES